MLMSAEKNNKRQTIIWTNRYDLSEYYSIVEVWPLLFLELVPEFLGSNAIQCIPHFIFSIYPLLRYCNEFKWIPQYMECSYIGIKNALYIKEVWSKVWWAIIAGGIRESGWVLPWIIYTLLIFHVLACRFFRRPRILLWQTDKSVIKLF